MQTMRESWTDERLDDLKGSIDERFDQVDKRFDQVDKRFDQVETRFKQVDARLDRMDVDIREIRRTMTQGFIATITIMVSCFFGLAGLLFVM